MISSRLRLFTSTTAAGLAIAGATALLLGWLSEEVMEGEASRFDAYLRGVIHSTVSPSLTSVMWSFTDLGSVAVLTSIFVVAVALFWIAGWRRAALVLTVAMAGALVLDEALKAGFHRHRPLPFFGIAAPRSFSYPSGHALFSFVFFSTLATLCTARIHKKWIRWVIWICAVILIALIGISRIYLGVHYPTDVIAGYLTGLIWVITVRMGDHLLYRYRT